MPKLHHPTSTRTYQMQHQQRLTPYAKHSKHKDSLKETRAEARATLKSYVLISTLLVLIVASNDLSTSVVAGLMLIFHLLRKQHRPE